mmetsp:Transcript_9410/g.14383  ORF Transcript_9410/g.14383 Transcript_9410/m.14383 type:complete len:118 (+) Transcript_9410:1688-2041(+)
MVKTYEVVLNHLDRICFGPKNLFLFKYPLKNYVKQGLYQLMMKDPNLDPEDVDILIEQRLKEQGIAQDTNYLACDLYDDQSLEVDKKMTQECFDQAYEEAHLAEKKKQDEKLIEQQQ